MPAGRRRAQRATIREVLDIAIELEKKTMALYVHFVKAFPRPEEVRNFWFGMARHEAAHCGALALVESMLASDAAAARTRLWFDPGTVTRLRALLSAYEREARGRLRLERAFEMAIDLEASELEDVVVDMMKVVKSPEWRARAIQLLIHDLGDLSYMIERYTPNEALLARADALVERRVERLAHTGTGRAAKRRATSE
jgi:rubrerythrin